MASNTKLQKTKNANGEISVASSMNSLVKNHFTNMTQQYNVYVSAINEMEEKIKALKSIMLSETFLQNCHNISLNNEIANATIPKNRESNKNMVMERTVSGRKNNPGTPVFTHYTSARRWYAPHDMAKINNSKIERVTKMEIKKKTTLTIPIRKWNLNGRPKS